MVADGQDLHLSLDTEICTSGMGLRCQPAGLSERSVASHAASGTHASPRTSTVWHTSSRHPDHQRPLSGKTPHWAPDCAHGGTGLSINGGKQPQPSTTHVRSGQTATLLPTHSGNDPQGTAGHDSLPVSSTQPASSSPGNLAADRHASVLDWQWHREPTNGLQAGATEAADEASSSTSHAPAAALSSNVSQWGRTRRKAAAGSSSGNGARQKGAAAVVPLQTEPVQTAAPHQQQDATQPTKQTLPRGTEERAMQEQSGSSTNNDVNGDPDQSQLPPQQHQPLRQQPGASQGQDVPASPASTQLLDLIPDVFGWSQGRYVRQLLEGVRPEDPAWGMSRWSSLVDLYAPCMSLDECAVAFESLRQCIRFNHEDVQYGSAAFRGCSLLEMRLKQLLLAAAFKDGSSHSVQRQLRHSISASSVAQRQEGAKEDRVLVRQLAALVEPITLQFIRDPQVIAVILGTLCQALATDTIVPHHTATSSQTSSQHAAPSTRSTQRSAAGKRADGAAPVNLAQLQHMRNALSMALSQALVTNPWRKIDARVAVAAATKAAAAGGHRHQPDAAIAQVLPATGQPTPGQGQHLATPDCLPPANLSVTQHRGGVSSASQSTSPRPMPATKNVNLSPKAALLQPAQQPQPPHAADLRRLLRLVLLWQLEHLERLTTPALCSFLQACMLVDGHAPVPGYAAELDRPNHTLDPGATPPSQLHHDVHQAPPGTLILPPHTVRRVLHEVCERLLPVPDTPAPVLVGLRQASTSSSGGTSASSNGTSTNSSNSQGKVPAATSVSKPERPQPLGSATETAAAARDLTVDSLTPSHLHGLVLVLGHYAGILLQPTASPSDPRDRQLLERLTYWLSRELPAARHPGVTTPLAQLKQLLHPELQAKPSQQQQQLPPAQPSPARQPLLSSAQNATQRPPWASPSKFGSVTVKPAIASPAVPPSIPPHTSQQASLLPMAAQPPSAPQQVVKQSSRSSAVQNDGVDKGAQNAAPASLKLKRPPVSGQLHQQQKPPRLKPMKEQEGNQHHQQQQQQQQLVQEGQQKQQLQQEQQEQMQETKQQQQQQDDGLWQHIVTLKQLVEPWLPSRPATEWQQLQDVVQKLSRMARSPLASHNPTSQPLSSPTSSTSASVMQRHWSASEVQHALLVLRSLLRQLPPTHAIPATHTIEDSLQHVDRAGEIGSIRQEGQQDEGVASMTYVAWVAAARDGEGAGESRAAAGEGVGARDLRDAAYELVSAILSHQVPKVAVRMRVGSLAFLCTTCVQLAQALTPAAGGPPALNPPAMGAVPADLQAGGGGNEAAGIQPVRELDGGCAGAQPADVLDGGCAALLGPGGPLEAAAVEALGRALLTPTEAREQPLQVDAPVAVRGKPEDISVWEVLRLIKVVAQLDWQPPAPVMDALLDSCLARAAVAPASPASPDGKAVQGEAGRPTLKLQDLQLSAQGVLLKALSDAGYLPNRTWMVQWYTATLPHLQQLTNAARPIKPATGKPIRSSTTEPTTTSNPLSKRPIASPAEPARGGTAPPGLMPSVTGPVEQQAIDAAVDHQHISAHADTLSDALRALASVGSAATGLQLATLSPPPAAWLEAFESATQAVLGQAGATLPQLRRFALGSPDGAIARQPIAGQLIAGRPVHDRAAGRRVWYPERSICDIVADMAAMACAIHTIESSQQGQAGQAMDSDAQGMVVDRYTGVNGAEVPGELLPGFGDCDFQHDGFGGWSSDAEGPQGNSVEGKKLGGDSHRVEVALLGRPVPAADLCNSNRRPWPSQAWRATAEAATLAALPYCQPGDVVKVLNAMVESLGVRPDAGWWRVLLSVWPGGRLVAPPAWVVEGVLAGLARARYRPPQWWMEQLEHVTLPRLGASFSAAQLGSCLVKCSSLGLKWSPDWMGCWYVATRDHLDTWRLEYGLEVLAALVRQQQVPPPDWLAALQAAQLAAATPSQLCQLTVGQACGWLWTWSKLQHPLPAATVDQLLRLVLLPQLQQLSWQQTCSLIHSLSQHSRTGSLTRPLQSHMQALLQHAANLLPSTVDHMQLTPLPTNQSASPVLPSVGRQLAPPATHQSVNMCEALAGNSSRDVPTVQAVPRSQQQVPAKALTWGLALVLHDVASARVQPPEGWTDRWVQALTAELPGCGEVALRQVLHALTHGLGSAPPPGISAPATPATLHSTGTIRVAGEDTPDFTVSDPAVACTPHAVKLSSSNIAADVAPASSHSIVTVLASDQGPLRPSQTVLDALVHQLRSHPLTAPRQRAWHRTSHAVPAADMGGHAAIIPDKVQAAGGMLEQPAGGVLQRPVLHQPPEPLKSPHPQTPPGPVPTPTAPLHTLLDTTYTGQQHNSYRAPSSTARQTRQDGKKKLTRNKLQRRALYERVRIVRLKLGTRLRELEVCIQQAGYRLPDSTMPDKG